MDQEIFEFQTDIDLKPGVVLISAANMADPNFRRSVVFICEHNEQGSFGLILNKKLSALQLSDSLASLVDWNTPLYQGGPVQLNTLHFLHTETGLPGSKEILPGVCWGGELDSINSVIKDKDGDTRNFRFFVGYSGWGEGQLEKELEYNSWYIASCSPEMIFHTGKEDLWKVMVRSLGGKFEILLNFPEDPSVN